MTGRRVVAALALAGVLATGCSASHHTAAVPQAPASVTAGAAIPAGAASGATQWWTSTDYCGMLRQTVTAGHSILPGVAASDPGYAQVTSAFVTQVQHSAPREVAGAWQVLGQLIVSLVHSSAAKAPSRAQVTKISSAVATVSADAKTRCGLDLSATAH